MIIMAVSECMLSNSLNDNENYVELYEKQNNSKEEQGYKCGEAYYVCSKGTINVRCTLCGTYFEYGSQGYHLPGTNSDENNEISDSNSGIKTNLKKNFTQQFEKLESKDQLKIRKFSKKRSKVKKEERQSLSCSEEFNDKCNLIKNVDITDLKASDGLICEQCGRKFARKNTLESHYEIAHNPNRKLFPCSECEKSFTTSEGLMAHNRHYHTKELPYICKVENCNKRYASQKGLKYHQAKHSNTTFSCSECNKQYSHKNKLQIHFKRHHSVGKTYHCVQCDKSFYGSYFLKKHMVCHTNERPFLCDQCPASFPRQKALIAHKKIHSGKRDEICKLCGQAFNLYEGLYQHMRIRHGIKYYRAMTLQDMKIKEKEASNTNS
ncbi:oocyte zinc finger protein XlCOF20-like isoform X2 [Condylostylus longicornis]|uniref:oocyte zinc finger protein XlCOF20-like isoform X2 n=1 Tax=Condylostylus longicornis TaxID=2530218 RepID=UPI00244DE9AA|nr:oocyte zinc finger protein XlCOF20-like isoform X2 [Condylostylus longicornis]